MKLKNTLKIGIAGVLMFGATYANAYCWNVVNGYGRVHGHCVAGPGPGPYARPGYGPYYYGHPGYGPGPGWRGGYGPYYYGPWHQHCWINRAGFRTCN